MTNSLNPLTKMDSATYPSASDSMGGAIISSMNQLSQDVSPLTRWRLRKVRGAEAVRLAETALAEYMAAKRRVFVYQVGLTEDHAKKVMLAKSIDDTATIEKEIARIIGETVRNFETLITGQEEAAYRAEIAKVGELGELLARGQISERRCKQLVGNIEASTDKIVETVQRTSRQILENLAGRFEAALRQG